MQKCQYNSCVERLNLLILKLIFTTSFLLRNNCVGVICYWEKYKCWQIHFSFFSDQCIHYIYLHLHNKYLPCMKFANTRGRNQKLHPQYQLHSYCKKTTPFIRLLTTCVRCISCIWHIWAGRKFYTFTMLCNTLIIVIKCEFSFFKYN